MKESRKFCIGADTYGTYTVDELGKKIFLAREAARAANVVQRVVITRLLVALVRASFIVATRPGGPIQMSTRLV